MSEKNPLISGIEQTSSSLSSDLITEKTTAHLPEEYSDDKLVLLPVNAHTQHFYWSVIDRELQIKLINRFAKFEVRLYLIDGAKRVFLESVEIQNAKGNQYTYATPNLKKMQAVLVMIENGVEKEILFSNIITAPSSGFHASPWEIWMNKSGHQSSLSSRASIDLPSEELLTTNSSLEMAIRKENLKARMGNFDLNAPSSDFASNHLFGSFDKAKGN